jgi:hypothetical protein
MEEILVKRPHIKRHFDRIEIENARVCTNEAFRNNTNEIGFRHYMQSLQVVRNGKHHVSFTALLPKPCIHGILCELTPDDGNVLRLQKLLWLSYPACARVATP